MGYFLICERMLPSVIAVRDRCLSKEGLMVPCRAKIFIAAAACSSIKNLKSLSYQNDAMRLEAIIKTVPPEQILSEKFEILELSLKDVRPDFDSFEARYSLNLLQSGIVNALVAWFDVEMTPNVWFSTSPFEPPTHWE